MMTDLFRIFKKENRLSLSAKERKTAVFYTVFFAVFFLLSALLMWTFVCSLCHMIGSVVCSSPAQAVVEMMRMMPLYLLAWSSAGIGIAALSLGRTEKAPDRAQRFSSAGYVMIAIGAVAALWVIIGLIVGKYEKLVEGYVFPLFPLDMLLGGLLEMLLGKHALTYAKRLKKSGNPQTNSGKKDSILFRVGRTASYILAACGFAAFFLGIFTMDWRHGNLFFNLMLLLCYASPVCMLAAYRYVTTDLTEEMRPFAQKQLSLLFLIANALLLALYLLAVQIENEAPNLNAFSVLPIEFTASFNAFLFCYPVANLVPPLVGLLKKKS